MSKKDIDYVLKKETTGYVLPLLDTEYRRFNKIRVSYKKVCKKIDKVPHDSLLARILNDLKEVGIVEKKEVKQEKGMPQTFYRISPKFKEIIWPMITKFTDKLLMDAYPLDQIISQSRITFYGLKNGVFVPPLKPENREFQYFTPEYIKLSKTGLTMNDFFAYKEGIFKGKERKSIGITEALDIITNKILELKKEYRLKELNKSYRKRLKEIKLKKLKLFFKKYSNIFLALLNESDPDKERIEQFILHPQILLVFDETYGKDIDRSSFIEKCHTLSSEEKNQVMEFLLTIIKDTIELYPTNVVIVCKTFSGKIIDEYKNDITKYLK